MACTLDSFALVSLEDVKDHLGITADDLTEDAFSIYHDETESATACTVGISGNVLTIIVTDGANAGTYTYNLAAAANITIALLLAVIAADTAGGELIVTQHCRDDVTSTDLIDFAATSCFGSSNTQTLTFVDNCQIIEMINIVSDIIEFAADRHFKQRAYTEWQDSDEDGWVQLRNFPVNWIDWVSASSAEVVKIKCTVTDAVAATVGVNHNPIPGSTQESPVDRLELIIVGGTNDGSDTITLAAATNLTSVVASINALTGWEASVQSPAGGLSNVGNMPSDWLREFGGLPCLNVNCFLQAPDTPTSWLDPQFKYGRFRSWYKSAKVWVRYTGGYAVVPDDIKWLAIEIIGELLEKQEQGFDPSLKSERLGDYSYTRAEDTNRSNAESALRGRMARIEPYRNVLY